MGHEECWWNEIREIGKLQKFSVRSTTDSTPPANAIASGAVGTAIWGLVVSDSFQIYMVMKLTTLN